MRRKDREVTDIGQIIEIIARCKVFRVAAAVNNVPYIVPLNFGYAYSDGQLSFCFHCAHEGKKLELFRQNPTVCFELDCDHKLLPADSACGYGYSYSSVVGSGVVAVVADPVQKVALLRQLMAHQAGRDFVFSPEQAATVTVCQIRVLEISAKQKT